MQYPLTEELNEMTLQVGIIGSDGTVIASDRLVTSFEGGSFSLGHSSKFESSKSVVCCWSGDQPAIYAANYIRDIEWETIHDRETKLKECGNRAWQTVFGSSALPTIQRGTARKVLVSFAADCSLWELEVSGYSLLQPVQNVAVVGDIRTTAKHFTNNYVPKSPATITELIPLAAHTILAAGRENNIGVGGIEVAILARGKTPYFLTREQELQLEALSNSIHASLGKQLLQPFDYRPVTPPQA